MEGLVAFWWRFFFCLFLLTPLLSPPVTSCLWRCVITGLTGETATRATAIPPTKASWELKINPLVTAKNVSSKNIHGGCPVIANRERERKTKIIIYTTYKTNLYYKFWICLHRLVVWTIFFVCLCVCLLLPSLEVTICAKSITSAIIAAVWAGASKAASSVPPVHTTFAHREQMPNQISTNSESKVGTGTEWICHCRSPSFVVFLGGVSFVYLFICLFGLFLAYAACPN